MKNNFIMKIMIFQFHLSEVIGNCQFWHIRGPFYQARVIIDSEINYNSDPLKIDFNFRSIISLRFMKRLIVDQKLKLISINYKVIIDFEKLQLILKSYN